MFLNIFRGFQPQMFLKLLVLGGQLLFSIRVNLPEAQIRLLNWPLPWLDKTINELQRHHCSFVMLNDET